MVILFLSVSASGFVVLQTVHKEQALEQDVHSNAVQSCTSGVARVL